MLACVDCLDTSKFPPTSRIYGKHGDFLASLATLSLLSVVSHHQQYASHNAVAIHNSKVLTRHVPCPAEQRFHTFDHGTRIAVRDLFGSMPVRVKHRAVLSSERSNLDREWARLAYDVVALLLAWPSDVAVLIRDTTTNREIRLKSPDTSDAVARTSRLLTQAALADSSDAESWIPVSASSGHVRVSGCISLNPVATRRAQFLSFGIRPTTNEHGTNVLFEEINKIFGNSSFGVVEEAGNSETRGDQKIHDGFSAALKSRKGIERWPMFSLQVSLPVSTQALGVDEILDGQQGDVTSMLNVLKAVCYGFLKKHHMRPRKIRMSAEESVFSTATTRSRSGQAIKRLPTSSARNERSHSSSRNIRKDSTSSRGGSPFDGWHRVKVGRATAGATRKADGSSRLDTQGHTRMRLTGEDGKLLSRPFDETSPEPDEPPGLPHTVEGDRETYQAATTPTGPTHALYTPGGTEPRTDQSQRPRGNRSVLEKRPKAQPSPWLQGVLRSWDNPVFETTQSSAPRVYHDPKGLGSDVHHENGTHRCGSGEDGAILFESASGSMNGRVSKAMLARAEVISQVDRKFILVKLPLAETEPGRATSTLIMLDQHAANERCRLEDLMAGYFEQDPVTEGLQPVVEALERPLMFDVSEKEIQLLGQHQEHFSSWAIVYQIRPGVDTTVHNRNQGAFKVKVTGLPPSIIERCKSEPRIIVDLMRKEAWKLHEEGVPLRGPSGDPVSKSLTSNFYGCPRGILELLHSRSCRSAFSPLF